MKVQDFTEGVGDVQENDWNGKERRSKCPDDDCQASFHRHVRAEVIDPISLKIKLVNILLAVGIVTCGTMGGLTVRFLSAVYKEGVEINKKISDIDQKNSDFLAAFSRRCDVLETRIDRNTDRISTLENTIKGITR